MRQFLGLLFCAGLFAAEAPPLLKTEITSDGGEFDFEKGEAHFRGNVKVVDPSGLMLTCEDLVSDLPVAGKSLERIAATTNVVIDITRPPRKPGDQPIHVHATAHQVTFSNTNQLITLIGNPVLEMAEIRTSAEESISYDLRTGNMKLKGKHRSEFKSEALKNSPLFKSALTNAPALK